GYIPDFMVASGLVSADKAKARSKSVASSLGLVLAGTEEIPGAGEYTGDNSEVVTSALEAGPTSDEQIIPQAAEAGPSNDEKNENQHMENGVPVLDGGLKSPERPNVNAVREALDTQAEMEVGMPIEEKVEEIKAEETAPIEVESGKGKQIIINIASAGDPAISDAETDIAAPTMTYLGETVQKGDETLCQVEMTIPGVGPMPIWMPLELLPDNIKAQAMGDTHRAGDEDAVDRTGDKEHDFNPKEAHGCGAKCERCGEIHGGDHQCKMATSDYRRLVMERNNLISENRSRRMKGEPVLLVPPKPEVPMVPIAYAADGTYEG